MCLTTTTTETPTQEVTLIRKKSRERKDPGGKNGGGENGFLLKAAGGHWRIGSGRDTQHCASDLKRKASSREILFQTTKAPRGSLYLSTSSCLRSRCSQHNTRSERPPPRHPHRCAGSRESPDHTC